MSAAPIAGSPAASSAPSEGRLAVLYDRDCGLCTATARRLRRWDRAGRLKLLPLQETATSGRPAIAAAGRHLPLASVLHVVDESTGEVHAGGDAAFTIAGRLPGGRVVRPVAALAPARWIVGQLYGVVARNRHRIGRWLRLEGPACDIPR